MLKLKASQCFSFCQKLQTLKSMPSSLCVSLPSTGSSFWVKQERNFSHHATLHSSHQNENNHHRVVFSGIQPTGNLHLGNYLGAVKNWVTLCHDDLNTKQQIESLIHPKDKENQRPSSIPLNQSSSNEPLFHEKFFCVVDLHAITVPQDPKALKESSVNLIAMLLACGLDPNKCSLFFQSQIPAHSQLSWILGCFITENRLKRMHHYKDKKTDNSSIGLVSYPVLMSADILLYSLKGNELYIPVGDDQRQHLELAQEVAQQMNFKFEGLFDVPRGIYPPHAYRVMSLRDGTKKMSKSDASDMSRINIVDTDDVIVQKIKKAKTDTLTDLTYDKDKRPEVANLIDIYAALQGKSAEEIVQLYSSVSENVNSKFKHDLADIVVETIKPIRENYNRYLSDPQFVQQVVKQGSERANEVTQKALRQIMDRIGFY
ncbi:hypothetical protein C9374_006653 [Naegleria lovaniensis]|uniref:tryptophan--tRNA ligase n=1 Tax=Naegleria lovaniensis TaxID=51637 RepID=A0AA88GNA0_NAELO|nr:uncharacterized protein C9374_006653 [Naegleria lovaniensis]KAG2379536.1 hypothetical protein C9374_006653 [Naegleria lovaniensis]